MRERLHGSLRIGLPELLWVTVWAAVWVSCGRSSHAPIQEAKKLRDAAIRAEAGTVDAGATTMPEPREAAAPADAAALDAAAPAEAAVPEAGRAKPGSCAPPASIDQPWVKLSETGCMDSAAPTKLAAKIVPYEVNSPLWSDSADKTRGMTLPAETKIHVKDCAKEPSACTHGAADDGKWVFPVGTVMVKSFAFDGKLVETRLFVHFDPETWVGYGYQWNEDQTEATIVPDERRKVMFNTGSRSVEWNYPSRLDCMKCHNPAGGSTLGPETAQMNRMVDGQNQLDKLAALGLFDASINTPYAAALVTPYAGQLGSPPASATVDERARSY